MANSSELVAPKRSDNMDIKGDWEIEETNIPRLDHRHFNVKLSNATTEVLFYIFRLTMWMPRRVKLGSPIRNRFNKKHGFKIREPEYICIDVVVLRPA